MESEDGDGRRRDRRRRHRSGALRGAATVLLPPDVRVHPDHRHAVLRRRSHRRCAAAALRCAGTARLLSERAANGEIPRYTAPVGAALGPNGLEDDEASVRRAGRRGTWDAWVEGLSSLTGAG